MIKKILKVTGIVFLVLIASAFIIPIAFKKQITELVKKEINKNLNAKVDFKNVNLSLFRHFPRISISLSDLSVIGSGEFANDTLIASKSIDASVNLFNLIKGKDIKVYGVYLDSPRIHALVNKDGKANWDIAKETSSATVSGDTSSTFSMHLQKYQVSNGYLLYQDESSDVYAELFNLNHTGKGDFTQDLFKLSTSTKADAVNLTILSVPYLINIKTGIGADIKIDNKNNRYDFETNDILLNNLKLSSKGFFQLVNDSTYNMDISFNSPSNDFKELLSMIPAMYTKDFTKIKTGGSAVLNGFVKGTYSPTQIPAYNLDLDIKDGFFQYPDLPEQVKNIQLALKVNNPDGISDNTVIEITKAHIEMGNEPFDFHLLYKYPETAQYIDVVAKGKLNLSQVSRYIKLEEGTKLSGLVWADVFAKGNLTAIQQKQGPFSAGGFLDISNLFYTSKIFPQPIKNGNMKIQIENTGGIADKTSINIADGHIEVGPDPVDFSLQVKNPISTVDFSGKAKGKFTLDNLKQFTQLEPGSSITGITNADINFSGSKADIDKKEYDKINTTGTVGFNNVKYIAKDYPAGITIASAQLDFNPKNAALKNFSGSYLSSHFTANGMLDNLIGYAMKDLPLEGFVNVTVDKMNLNDWMGTDTVSSSLKAASSDPFLVPGNINMVLNAEATQVKYDKVDYNNIKGTLAIKDETVKLQNIKTDALDGTMIFNGSYSTKTNKKEPGISISYDVKDLNIQKTFFAFNTIQKLMPIGNFLDGKLTSQLTMTGALNGKMMPELSSLTGNGNLLVLEGFLKKFTPLEKLAAMLQIDELREITLRNIKSYFEFANGKVLVKPFTIKIKDIEMLIGGMHGIDQSLNYIIQMKVPRKYLGTKGNDLINNLATQATNRGIPVNLGEVVELNIRMGGTITNPTIKTDLAQVAGDAVKELKQQAVDFVKQKIDSTKQTIKDSLNDLKKQVTDELKEELKNQIFGNKDSTKQNNLDSTKKNVEKTFKKTINKLLNKKKKTESDSTNN